MRTLRPASYWAVVLGVLAVSALAARAGLRLLRSVERVPHRVEWALRLRLAATEVQGRVADLEASRQAYALLAAAEQLRVLSGDHQRVHAAFAVLRRAAGGAPAMVAVADSAERVVGEWTDEIVPSGDVRRLSRADMRRGASLVEAVRRQLATVLAVAEREHALAQAEVGAAHRRAEWLWLVATTVVVLVLVVFVELAYRRRLRVAEAARQMDQLLGALPFTLFGLDLEGRIRQATGFIHEVVGLAPRALAGRRVTELLAEADGETVEAALRAARRGVAKACEVVTRGNGGAARVLSMMFSPIRARGAVVGVSAVVHDISTERALRAQVLQSDRLATVGALVAGVVHEINNPLSAIVGLADVIDRSGLAPDDRAAVETIASEGRRAAQIARNLLDFSRQRGRPHGPTDLARVLERTAALRIYELRVHGVRLDVAIADELPAVDGDAQQLQQVFLNLLVNAEHAVQDRPERRIAIRAEPTDGWVRVSVEDNGPGVPDDKREAVFEPFYTTKPEGEGTGLGLAVSRGIMAAHHGKISVERSALGGARFVVDLRALSLAGGAAARNAGASILVVDDDPASRGALARLLQRLGYAVCVASDGREALAAIERQPIAAILSDVHMPVLDGAGLYHALAERSPRLASRIAFVSGDADPAGTGLAAAGRPLLRKPFELSELQAVVEALLAQEGADS